jgi:hypothetical protein
MPANGVLLKAPHAVARINHGRWIADCPFGCMGAEYVDLTNPEFFCCNCRNADVKNHLVPIDLPPIRRANAIESLLMRRKIVNRNWHPGESLKDLRDENVVYGVTT